MTASQENQSELFAVLLISAIVAPFALIAFSLYFIVKGNGFTAAFLMGLGLFILDFYLSPFGGVRPIMDFLFGSL
ncbi:MAG: hypothetical protein LBI31_00535 [Zoogloeaceae bacterium]|jgi:hypothetical protein|nr:hypothetical protein [Zoogloeaceae bacterium]